MGTISARLKAPSTRQSGNNSLDEGPTRVVPMRPAPPWPSPTRGEGTKAVASALYTVIQISNSQFQIHVRILAAHGARALQDNDPREQSNCAGSRPVNVRPQGWRW